MNLAHMLHTQNMLDETTLYKLGKYTMYHVWELTMSCYSLNIQMLMENL